MLIARAFSGFPTWIKLYINSCKFLKNGPLCSPLTFERSPDIEQKLSRFLSEMVLAPSLGLKKVRYNIQRCYVYCNGLFVLHSRACLKNHSWNLHAPLCGIFCLRSVDVARYAALIQTKSPTNCDIYLAESIFKTHSRKIRRCVW